MHELIERARVRTDGFTVTPSQYLTIAYVALAALTLIVWTGAAVRLSGSGLGCPTWPKCYGSYYPPLNSHAVIEFSNRADHGARRDRRRAGLGRGAAPPPLPARPGVARRVCCRSA